MPASLLPIIGGVIVSASTSIALDNAAKIIIPSSLNAVTTFAVKAGVSIASGVIAGKVAEYVIATTQSIVDTVKSTGADVEPAQEDL